MRTVFCLVGLVLLGGALNAQVRPAEVERATRPPARAETPAVDVPVAERAADFGPGARPQLRWTTPTVRVVGDAGVERGTDPVVLPAPSMGERHPSVREPGKEVSPAHDRAAAAFPMADTRAMELHRKWSTRQEAPLVRNAPIVRMPFREASMETALDELSMQDFNRYVFRRNHSAEPGEVPVRPAGGR